MNKWFVCNWFKLNRSLHRDVGYLCVGLTIVFAVSGIAVNHINDWNPNYQVSRQQLSLPTQPWQTMADAEIEQVLLLAVASQEPRKTSYWSSANEFRLFLKSGSNLTLNTRSSTLMYEEISPRPVLQAFNRLHLNEGHRAWVIFSDLYAALLLFLAISALFMVKGNRRSRWRKYGLLTLGVAVPALFIFL